MQYRILDLSFSPRTRGIDDEPLQRLLHGHEAVSITEHFYSHEGTPHLLVGVAYRLAAPHPVPKPSAQKAENRSRDHQEGNNKWDEILDEANRSLFNTLRAWRTARARADGVPPYIILTNVQLAEIANKRPATRTALKAIPGVGEGRIDKFGEELLRVTTTGVIPVEMKPVGKPRDRNLESPGEGAGGR